MIPTTALGSGSIHHKGARDKGARVGWKGRLLFGASVYRLALVWYVADRRRMDIQGLRPV